MNTYRSIEKANARIKELEHSLITGESSPLTPEPFAWERGYVEHKGKRYVSTRKWGNRRRDGVMGLEFQAPDHSRVWVYRDQRIKED